MSWFEASAEGTILRLQIQSKASKTEVAGVIGEPPRMKVRVAAPPVDGEANEELLRFLKKMLRAPGARFEILRGHTSKMKDVLCTGVSPEQVQSALSFSED